MNDELAKFKEKFAKDHNIQNVENINKKFADDERIKKFKEQIDKKQAEIDNLRDEIRKKEKEHNLDIFDFDKWKELSVEDYNKNLKEQQQIIQKLREKNDELAKQNRK